MKYATVLLYVVICTFATQNPHSLPSLDKLKLIQAMTRKRRCLSKSQVTHIWQRLSPIRVVGEAQQGLTRPLFAVIF